MNLALLLSIAFLLYFCVTVDSSTSRPIIGVLVQETNPTIKKYYHNAKSYVAASYVKSIEGSGARVAPIFIGQQETYYDNIVSYINGLLLPGGNTFFNNTNGYADAAHMLMTKIRRMPYFPVLGICLGFEVLLYSDCNKSEKSREPCKSLNTLLPLNFKPNYNDSLLFEHAPSQIIDILRTSKTTYNSHIFCVTEKVLQTCNLQDKWKVLSTNLDINGKEFISTLESTSLSIAGLQFHPEKIYEWKKSKNYPHSQDSITAMRYFFDWLVDHARKNSHAFPSYEAELDSLISNYDKTFTIENLIYDELYLFNKENESTDGSDNDGVCIACKKVNARSQEKRKSNFDNKDPFYNQYNLESCNKELSFTNG
ncbi:gamma-glutamyl hydrolase A-like [Cimex lectularius]|uniref:folate gamma-glutamyl hydrolase n=1 Tax=Cimex lectularius TaxID=79782 RepID=A0A8I6SEW9_CIMLE|nr:gamma-glutamyl hydrolase A-like [Cimex lectularius]XP_014262396.1 gamma-glutamyl hydrolase A-like [Cimex lectularius]